MTCQTLAVLSSCHHGRHSLPQVAEEDVVHKRLGFAKVSDGSDEDSEKEDNAKKVNTAQKDGFNQHSLGFVLNWNCHINRNTHVFTKFWKDHLSISFIWCRSLRSSSASATACCRGQGSYQNFPNRWSKGWKSQGKVKPVLKVKRWNSTNPSTAIM